jgi:hypothetical protein
LAGSDARVQAYALRYEQSLPALARGKDVPGLFSANDPSEDPRPHGPFVNGTGTQRLPRIMRLGS